MKNKAAAILGIICIACIAINAFIWTGILAAGWGTKTDDTPAGAE